MGASVGTPASNAVVVAGVREVEAFCATAIAANARLRSNMIMGIGWLGLLRTGETLLRWD